MEPVHTLFRQEAVDARRASLIGESLKAHAISFPRLTACSLGLVAALVAFGGLAEVTRKAHVQGYLAPSAGLIKVYSPEGGTLVERHVFEGQAVRRGDPLFVVSTERASVQTAQTRAAAIARIEQRLENLQSERAGQERLAQVQSRSLRGSLASQERELQELDEALKLQQERAANAEEIAKRHAELLAQHFVSQIAADEKHALMLEQQSRLQDLRRAHTQLKRQIDTQREDLASSQINARQRISEIEREALALDQERTEQQSRRMVVITAPADGTVTAIAGDIGQTITDRSVLLAVLPKNAQLQAKLLVPSSSIGFVSTGDSVWLRYQAFPYQRFGSFRGEVVEIARTLMAPADLDLPVTVQQPFYRVTVRLGTQQIETASMKLPLQAGMQLDADISLERRRVLEWLLEPLFSVTKRL